MGKTAVHEFITLDGVIQDPSWTAQNPFDPRMGEAIAALTDPDGAILLGRRTYEMSYPAWSTRTTDDNSSAPFFNETEKYVVTSTPESAEWSNSTILGPYDPGAIQSLKDRIDGTICVSGSATLV
jgi:dihydrofolate reductase